MLRTKINEVVLKCQENSSCHRKYVQILEQYYKESCNKEFVTILISCFERIFSEEKGFNNPYIERYLDFLAKFCVEIYFKDDTEDTFLYKIVRRVLKYHNVAHENTRYQCCNFIILLLKHIGTNGSIDNRVCDLIQKVMLDRVQDPKMNIRLKALAAMVRLQQPCNLKCPVIAAFARALNDPKVQVRREATRLIAPNQNNLLKIRDKARDINHSVRERALTRIADIGPKPYNIISRQMILSAGFMDENAEVKKIFNTYLIPKWVTAYNDDYAKLLHAIRLDADEDDIATTIELSSKLLKVIFRMTPIDDLITSLELDDNKLIQMAKLNTEYSFFFKSLVKYLKQNDGNQEYCDLILPELTQFCDIIERFLNEHFTNPTDCLSATEIRLTLSNLFDIAMEYDLGDEVGRKNLYSLVSKLLTMYRMDLPLLEKLLCVAAKCIPDIDMLSSDICFIISEIREPMTEQLMTAEQVSTKQFEIAQIKVKLNELQINRDLAVNEEDFQRAAVLQTASKECERQIDELHQRLTTTEQVRTTKNDSGTVCRCLDIMLALLRLPNVTNMTPALSTFKTEFLMVLITQDDNEVHCRILKCLLYLCLIDKSTAEQYCNLIVVPLATYQVMDNSSKEAVLISIEGVTDLIQLFGTSLFWPQTDQVPNNNNSKTNNINSISSNNSVNCTEIDESVKEVSQMEHMRNDSETNQSNISQKSFTLATFDVFLDILMDILHSECDRIKNTALDAIGKLVTCGYQITPHILSRILLKWYNPSSKNTEDNLNLKLGIFIHRYMSMPGASEIIEGSIIPTLSTVANAPHSSPLTDIDIDNVINFFASFLNSIVKNGVVHLSRTAATNICTKIRRNANAKVVRYLAKMLVSLNCEGDHSAETMELIAQSDLLKNKIKDKIALKYIEKFRRVITVQMEKCIPEEPTIIAEDDRNVCSEKTEEPMNQIEIDVKCKLPNSSSALKNCNDADDNEDGELQQSNDIKAQQQYKRKKVRSKQKSLQPKAIRTTTGTAGHEMSVSREISKVTQCSVILDKWDKGREEMQNCHVHLQHITDTNNLPPLTDSTNTDCRTTKNVVAEPIDTMSLAQIQNDQYTSKMTLRGHSQNRTNSSNSENVLIEDSGTSSRSSSTVRCSHTITTDTSDAD